MISFLGSVIALIVGYFLYGRFVERVFGTDDANITPAFSKEDGVDYIPISTAKVFLIQFLNIAGLGPIFGAVAGALWGPVVFIWIVLGSIFAGAVHDFLAGMLSLKHGGESIGEIVGRYLGPIAKVFMRFFSVVLLMLVGVVFMSGPSDLLHELTGFDKMFWLAAIIAYCIGATILPIDKIIARIYPILGASLIIMAVGIVFGLISLGYHIPEISFSNLHPEEKPIFPFLFITVACGAISGFHATQSPIMARCLKNERDGRKVFYGAMVAEGVIALVWAAAAIAFFGNTYYLAQGGSPAVVVNTISTSFLGSFGGALVLLGVVACPISSGDTAFRSARYSIADALNLNQERFRDRLYIAIPLFSVGIALCFIDFAVIWRYFAWANQTLATLLLWAGAVYLGKAKKFHWIASLPAVFMTAVVITYIITAPEGLNMSREVGLTLGASAGLLSWLRFYSSMKGWQVQRDFTSR